MIQAVVAWRAIAGLALRHCRNFVAPAVARRELSFAFMACARACDSSACPLQRRCTVGMRCKGLLAMTVLCRVALGVFVFSHTCCNVLLLLLLGVLGENRLDVEVDRLKNIR